MTARALLETANEIDGLLVEFQRDISGEAQRQIYLRVADLRTIASSLAEQPAPDLLRQARAVLSRFKDDDAATVVNRIDARLSAAEQPAHSRAQDSGGEAVFRCTVCGSHCDSDGRSLYRPPAEQPGKGEEQAWPATREEMDAYWAAYSENRASGEGAAIRAGLEAYRACLVGNPMPTPQPSDPADAEKWGQHYRCGCFLGFPTKRAIPASCPQHMRDKQGGALPLDTTPPTAQRHDDPSAQAARLGESAYIAGYIQGAHDYTSEPLDPVDLRVTAEGSAIYDGYTSIAEQENITEQENFRGESFAQARQKLINVLKAQKSWVTGYAEAYVDDFAKMAAHGAGAAVEAVAWQYRFQFTDGAWSGWAQVQSASELEHLLSRYRELKCPAEGRSLFAAPPQQRSDEAKPASPNDCRDVSAVIRHGLFFYEVDFGDEGKGCYVRLYDFNRVVEKLEKAAHGDGAAVEAVAEVEDAMGTGILIPKWRDDLPENPFPAGTKLYLGPRQKRSEHVAGGGGVDDEAVQRAEEAFWPVYIDCVSKHQASRPAHKIGMRAALESFALSTQPLLSDPAGGFEKEETDNG